MFPGLFQYGSANSSLRNTNLLGKCGLGFAISVSFAYLYNLAISQFRHAVILAFCGAFLINHVLRIGLLGAGKKMSGINAGRVIATMKNAARRKAIMKFIGKAVRWCRIAIPPESSISVLVASSIPFPAFIGATFVYLFPETLFIRLCPLRIQPMSFNKPHGLSLDPSIFGVSLFRYWGEFAAAALTKPCPGVVHTLIIA